jgi:hypothetical protein
LVDEINPIPIVCNILLESPEEFAALGIIAIEIREAAFDHKAYSQLTFLTYRTFTLQKFCCLFCHLIAPVRLYRIGNTGPFGRLFFSQL